MREEYEKEIYIFYPVNQMNYTQHLKLMIKKNYSKAYDKRMPGLFKVETTKDKWFHYVQKCIVVLTSQKKIKSSCKGIQKDKNNVNVREKHPEIK